MKEQTSYDKEQERERERGEGNRCDRVWIEASVGSLLHTHTFQLHRIENWWNKMVAKKSSGIEKEKRNWIIWEWIKN